MVLKANKIDFFTYKTSSNLQLITAETRIEHNLTQWEYNSKI